MPRKSRLVLPGVPLHIYQRGNNGIPCFVERRDKELYLGLLAELAPRHHCAIHAYVLMTNHVHILLTPTSDDGASRLIKNVGERYVAYFNRSQHRTGGLWDGRFNSCLIDSETYLFTCYRYIELNPVRARMVSHPSEYEWSSYMTNAEGEASALITPHPQFAGLSADIVERQRRYRGLFSEALSDVVLEDLRRATRGGFAVGDAAFIERAEVAFGRPVEPAMAGRGKARATIQKAQRLRPREFAQPALAPEQL